MSNVTFLSFNGLQPVLSTLPLQNYTNNYTDNVIFLIEEHHFSTYQRHNISTIILMIFAWALLIVGFTICCCSQCFGKFKRLTQVVDVERNRASGGRNAVRDGGGNYGDRTNHNDPIEICRRYPLDFESESLPSYTIVSGLPTYDDAIEEFRKAGIILKPPMPIIKIFESDSKQAQIYNLENELNDVNITNSAGTNENGSDNISLNSTCTCGAGSGGSGTSANSTTPLTPNNSMMNLCLPNGTSAANQIIELTPEQLAILSQKRLSLQIAFSGSPRRNSRPRIDLYRAAARNNHLRSRAISNMGFESFGPQIHRSASSNSLTVERNLQHHLQQHRGSLC